MYTHIHDSIYVSKQRKKVQKATHKTNRSDYFWGRKLDLGGSWLKVGFCFVSEFFTMCINVLLLTQLNI